MVGKVKDSSKYWLDWDYDTINYHISWDKNQVGFLLKNQVDFLLKYTLLTFKYGICVIPFENINVVELRGEIERTVSFKKFSTNTWIPLCFNALYEKYNYIKPSYLFLGEKKELFNIVNLPLLLTFEEVLNKRNNESDYGYPVGIEFFQDSLSINFTSNALLPILYGQKTGWETRYIDNSDLAYLNGTRFNSFLRDLKILCFQYGATKLKHREDYLDYIIPNPLKINSEEGILFGDEVLYYEDIYEILPKRYKFTPFKEVQLELDDTKYKEYLKSKE